MTYNDDWWVVVSAFDHLTPDKLFYLVRNPHGEFYSQRYYPPTPAKYVDQAERFYNLVGAQTKAKELNDKRMHDWITIKEEL